MHFYTSFSFFIIAGENAGWGPSRGLVVSRICRAYVVERFSREGPGNDEPIRAAIDSWNKKSRKIFKSWTLRWANNGSLISSPLQKKGPRVNSKKYSKKGAFYRQPWILSALILRNIAKEGFFLVFLKPSISRYVLQLHAVFFLVEPELGHGLSKFAKSKILWKIFRLQFFHDFHDF